MMLYIHNSQCGAFCTYRCAASVSNRTLNESLYSAQHKSPHFQRNTSEKQNQSTVHASQLRAHKMI